MSVTTNVSIEEWIAGMIQASPVIRIPRFIAVRAGSFRVRKETAIWKQITTVASTERSKSVLAFGSICLRMNSGTEIYCCQNTTKKPEKMIRKATKRKFRSTTNMFLISRSRGFTVEKECRPKHQEHAQGSDTENVLNDPPKLFPHQEGHDGSEG